MKKVFGLFGLLLMACTSVDAQYFEKTYSLLLEVGKPLNNTSYVNDVSARGFRFGYREMITEKFFGGLDINNSSFNSHVPRRTYNNGTNAITTDLFNYAYCYGATLSFNYIPNAEKKLMPYVGLGVGASFIRFRQFYNVYSSQTDSWGVLVRPEAGMMYRVKENASWALQAALHYDYTSAKNEDLNQSAFQTIGASVGIIILDW